MKIWSQLYMVAVLRQRKRELTKMASSFDQSFNEQIIFNAYFYSRVESRLEAPVAIKIKYKSNSAKFILTKSLPVLLKK